MWGNASKINDNLLLQKKAVRIIYPKHNLDHCKSLFINLQIPTFVNLYLFDIDKYTFLENWTKHDFQIRLLHRHYTIHSSEN